MDTLRPTACYRIRAKIFRDDDTLYHLRWFWVPSDTAWMPEYHRFASGVWSQGTFELPGIVGEHKGSRRVWDRGLPPVGRPQQIGTPDDFFEGPAKGAVPELVRDGRCCCPGADDGIGRVSACNVCDCMPKLWQLVVPFEDSHGGEHVWLTWLHGCRFSSTGWTGCEKCNCMPVAWYVQYDGPCRHPGPQFIIGQQGCVFSSCKKPPPDF